MSASYSSSEGADEPGRRLSLHTIQYGCHEAYIPYIYCVKSGLNTFWCLVGMGARLSPRRTRGTDTGHDLRASMELASHASRLSRDASWRLDRPVLQFNSMGYMPQYDRDEKATPTVRVYLN